MTDNSKFVLRWEIDNPAVTLAKGKAESGMFNKGVFNWLAKIRPNRKHVEVADFILICAHPGVGTWKCEADVEFVLHDGKENYSEKKHTTFHHVKSYRNFSKVDYFTALTDVNSDRNMDGKVVIEFNVNIISLECAPILDVAKFSSPNETNNVTLVVGKKKVQVSKDYLAIHSPIFSAMFFGNFAEKGKNEVELKDIVYEELLDLLLVIYPGTMDITDRTALHILKLADQFQMERVLDQSEKHLIQSKKFDVVKKLLLADQYRFVSLREHCLHSFTRAIDVLQKLMSSPEYARFSGDLKIAICDRMAELSGSVS